MDIKKISDEELVKSSLKDTEMFRVLMERYEQKLTYYIIRISGFCLETAEEILQDTFLKCWRNLNDFDQSVKFSSWIYRIAHNETISTYRKQKSRGEDQQLELIEELFVPDKIDFVRDLDKKMSVQNIQEVLALMDVKYREILILKFLEEKSYEEISDIIQKPLGTIATLINRAKTQFKDISNRHQISF
ncbi:RNA polymerase sigma factor [Candidatus Gracilibacteria bacterium]|nr:RNA polymerase sigma factor [Candidatus Gracilibacteria bacterium]